MVIFGDKLRDLQIQSDSAIQHEYLICCFFSKKVNE